MTRRGGTSVRTMLAQLQLERFASVFEEEEIDSVPLLRSMGGLLGENLAELGLDKAAQQAVCAYVLEGRDGAFRAAAEDASLSGDEAVGGDGARRVAEDHEEAGEVMDVPKASGHKVYLSAEEFERMMDESDDDDTAQGRARRRIKADISSDAYRATMLGPNDEGIVVDCSCDFAKGKSPRHALKKLLSAGKGLSTPTPRCEVELCYQGRLTATGAVFDDKFATQPRTLNANDPSLPKGLWMVVNTMREGERALASLHHKVAFGKEGNAALCVPPDAFVEYEVKLLKVYDILEYEAGAIKTKILQLPKFVGNVTEGDEVEVRWKGEVLDDKGEPVRTFQPTKLMKFVLGPPQQSRSASGALVPLFIDGPVRKMGEGEVHEMVVHPSWAYGEQGEPKLRVPPRAHVKIRLELVAYTTPEDISPPKNGTAVKRVLRRGEGDETPHKGDEVTISFKISSQLTKRLLHERASFSFRFGEMDEPAASALRRACAGAHADTILTLLVAKMHKGECVELRCTTEYSGGSDDLVVEVELLHFIKEIICPNTDGQVKVQLVKDDVPAGVDSRGPNAEARVRVRYKVRDHEGKVIDESGEEPVAFTQGSRQVMPCIDEAVLQMRPHGKAIVHSSREWAYGTPGGNVQVELELVDFQRFQPHYGMELDEKLMVQVRRKEEGNALFKKGEYEEALKKYEAAIEYTALGCEVQKRDDRSLQQKERERKLADEVKMASHVNSALCYLRLAEKAYAHERLSKREKAIEECNKALRIDRTHMKALYRRGQAYMAIGDCVNARDDLLSAARKAPDAKEIRDEIAKLKQLEKAQEEDAKSLWKKNFITEQMSVRAQHGVMSVSEAVAKSRAAAEVETKADVMHKESGDDEDLDVVIEEVGAAPSRPALGSSSFKKGFLSGKSLSDPSQQHPALGASEPQGIAGGDGRALQAALPASAQSASAASEATGIQVVSATGRARLALPYGEENELMPWDAGALQGGALEEQNDECGSSAEEEGGASGRDETDDVIIEEDGKTLRLTPPKQKSALKVAKKKTKKLPTNAKPARVLPYGIDLKGDGSFVKQVLRPGNAVVGKAPAGALVKVHYEAWLMDGTKIENTRERFGNPFIKIGANMDIPLVEQGIATMNKGELAEFVGEARYAYGVNGNKGKGVPPKATLRFVIELYSWSGITEDMSNMDDAQVLDQAFFLKDKAKEYFDGELYLEAQERYHEAASLIDHPKFNLRETLSDDWVGEARKLKLACWLNEAMCELRLENWTRAIASCDKVLALESANVKALFRRGSAHMGNQDFQAARKDLSTALELSPKSTEIKNALAMCKIASRAADKKQQSQFANMFTNEKKLYEDGPEIPQWLGPLPTVWLEVAIDGRPAGRIVIELFAKHAPKTAENFRSLCTGERGLGKYSKIPLHYKGTPFHRVINGFLIQGGDIVKGNGLGGECIYGGHFHDENLDGVHDQPGIVSMANVGPNSNSSQFFITTVPAAHLDKKHVVVGRVVEGMALVCELQRVPTDQNDAPQKRILISDCGSECLTAIPFEVQDASGSKEAKGAQGRT
ncbi:hypothetical protein AB1Y20_014386 [Prymnesium parvum]|uniref:peptidylprolyl isomerase n=1 Tax=Prymnesium parvum TaxID=97485 RepID=A0AB34IF27_PRYPA